MLPLSDGVANVGMKAKLSESGEWVISNLVPAGVGFDSGVRRGYKVLYVDGVPAAALARQTGETDFAGARSIQVARPNGALVTVDVGGSGMGDPIYSWGFAILGLTFIFVGGPVYVKARQRSAALTFYVFCVASALALLAATPSFLGHGWALTFMFFSLIVWSASFASFFLIFPVPIARTRHERTLMFFFLGGIGLAIAGAYLWVLLGNTEAYAGIRLLMAMFVGCCVIIGLARLGWVLRTTLDPEVRRQLALLMLGTGFAVGPPLLLSLLPSMFFGSYIVQPFVSTLTLGIMPLAFAYAITQHQLLGMRGFVRRSVIYLVMGFTVVLIFSFAAAGLSRFVPTGWEHEELGILAFGVFVFLLALSFGYIQKRVERLVDHFIYHDAYDYKEELLRFSAHLAAEQNLETLAGRLVERTCRLMNLSCGILLLSVDPNDATSTTMQRARFNTGGLHPETLFANGEPLYTGPLSHTVLQRPDDPYLLPYVQYGDCADWFLHRLQQELANLGVDLRFTEAPTRLFYVNADNSSHAEDEAGQNTDFGSKAQTVDGMQSFLGVPLWTRQRFVGVLCLGNKKTGERFTRDDVSLLTTLGAQAALAIHNAQLYEMREQALLDTITALAHAIEAKDTYTINHCEKITGRAVSLAEHMGLPNSEIENIRLGSILHDVGKIGVPDAILNKPGKLTTDEYERIKEHSTIGARIVQSVGALQGVVPIVRHHQERYDGSGYPDRLRGEQIPLGARIIAVVDAYGAMTEDRIYRKAPGHNFAISELKRYSGTQFDPDIASAFIDLLEEQPDLAE
jgi:putative nucleotidyltransferase with HDIG domain